MSLPFRTPGESADGPLSCILGRMATSLNQMKTAYTLTHPGQGQPYLITTDLKLFVRIAHEDPESTVEVLTNGSHDEKRTEIMVLNI